jgi:hypothetical protein
MTTKDMAAASVPALEEDMQERRAGRRRIAIVAAIAVGAALAAFLVGRLGGSTEKTVHTKQPAKSHSLVVVAKTSPRVTSLASASIAPLVAPPPPPSSGGGSTGGGSTGGGSTGGGSTGGGTTGGTTGGGGTVIGGSG